jgi:hypothetical protein
MSKAFERFVSSYLETALWASFDEAGNSLRDYHNLDADDMPPDALAEARADCEAFWGEHQEDIEANPSRAGHDFFLTRNRHGAGFWDGDWPQDVGRRLTEASHVYGTWELALDDSGTVYCHG